MGFPYKVSFVKDLIQRFGIVGCGSVWGADIQIDPSVTNLDILSSVLHEAVEIMFRKTGTRYKHEIIEKFEVFMMMLIIENPELMELILETAKKEGGPIKGSIKKGAKVMGKRRKGK